MRQHIRRDDVQSAVAHFAGKIRRTLAAAVEDKYRTVAERRRKVRGSGVSYVMRNEHRFGAVDSRERALNEVRHPRSVQRAQAFPVIFRYVAVELRCQ